MSAIWVLTDKRYSGQRMPTALLAWLRAEGHEPRVIVADGGGLLARLAPTGQSRDRAASDGPEAGDIVVARSRHPFALALLCQAEARGCVAANASAAIEAVRNKVRCTLTLRAWGVPVPKTVLVRRPVDAARLPKEWFPLLLKPVEGDNGDGIVLVRDPRDLAAVDWQEPLALVQPFLEAHGIDLKVYVADGRTWAVRRPSSLRESGGRAERVAVTGDLLRIAATCGEAFGLGLYGVDVLETAEGPVVVDVNEFPNYTGVDEAPETIGAFLLRLAEAGGANAEIGT